MAAFLAVVAVAVVRGLTGGASSPLTPLFALPMIWIALTGSRRQVAAAVGLTAAAFVVPILAIGAPRYPSDEWLRALLWVGVVGAVGVTLLRLRRHAEERHQTIAGVTQDALVVMSQDGRVREWSPAAEALFGWSQDEAVGAELAELVIPAHLREAHRRGLRRFLETGEGPLLGRRVEVTATCRDGGERPVELTISPWRSQEGWLFFAGVHDLSERLRAVEMELLAHTDPLTRLANRRGLDEHVSREIARARRSGRPLCLALLDLDGFKDYNDTHGHLAGDRVLKLVARAWRVELRESDLLARYGGDEFAAVLPDCQLEDGIQLVERLRRATPPGVACSGGVVQWDPQDDLIALLDRADAALYADKGGNGRRQGGLAATPPPG